jgi:hypothetical protein
MNQRLSYSEAAPAVYKAMLALQASVDKSGLEKDLMDLVCPAHFTSQEDESAPGKLTLEHCCVSARPELLGFTNFEKENTGVHTGRDCGACDFGAWKSTRQASSQEFI